MVAVHSWQKIVGGAPWVQWAVGGAGAPPDPPLAPPSMFYVFPVPVVIDVSYTFVNAIPIA